MFIVCYLYNKKKVLFQKWNQKYHTKNEIEDIITKVIPKIYIPVHR